MVKGKLGPMYVDVEYRIPNDGAFSCTAPGPQPLGCINARTTLVSKTDSALGDKAASWKANALENIDALSLRTLMQPEGCGPGAVSLLRVQIGAVSECADETRTAGRMPTDLFPSIAKKDK
jgi:hypothetical protein